jgi:hypothetical protein
LDCAAALRVVEGKARKRRLRIERAALRVELLRTRPAKRVWEVLRIERR